MISLGLVVICLVLYLAELYAAAFWVTVFAIANGLFGAIRAILNPEWYYNERTKAGLNSDIFNPERHVRNMLIVKIIVISVLSFVAWHFGEKAGYI